MINTVDEYSNLGGYGIFCGKKCVAEKQAQGIPPKRGKKNIAEFEQMMQQRQQEQMVAQEAQSGGGSKTGLIIGGVALLAVTGIIIYIIKKRKAK
jgi:hypothetical protein